MPVALACTIIAVLLFIIMLLIVPVVVIRKGAGIKYVYGEAPLPPGTVIPGEIIEDDDTAFFDEHDLAVMEAHEERPEFIRTQVLLNGVETGPDGLVVPEEKEKPWWRR